MYSADHPAFQLRHMSINGPCQISVECFNWKRNGNSSGYSYGYGQNNNSHKGKYNLSYGMNIVDFLEHGLLKDEEGGISTCVDAHAYGQTKMMYLPAFDFSGKVLSDLGKTSIRGKQLDELFAELSGMFSGNRLYIYDTGNSCHGYIPDLMEANDYYLYAEILRKADLVVDQKWMAMGGMCLRWTKGSGNRCRPTLKRTILL